MERLTTNKDVSEMGMYELAHNSCYYEDGEARYRDFEIDTSARDFARNLMTTLCDEDMPVDDESFDEEILENLQYDPFATKIGLIALFYRNLWAMADLRERLKEYEDAEEQGLLFRNPIATIKFSKEDMQELVNEKVKEIEIDIQAIRNKAFDDFADKLKENISESLIWGMIADCFKYKNMNDTSGKIVDYVIDTANEIAEQLKVGGENERNTFQSKTD